MPLVPYQRPYEDKSERANKSSEPEHPLERTTMRGGWRGRWRRAGGKVSLAGTWRTSLVFIPFQPAAGTSRRAGHVMRLFIQNQRAVPATSSADGDDSTERVLAWGTLHGSPYTSSRCRRGRAACGTGRSGQSLYFSSAVLYLLRTVQYQAYGCRLESVGVNDHREANRCSTTAVLRCDELERFPFLDVVAECGARLHPAGVARRWV